MRALRRFSLAAVAAVFHMMNHATFKASLFMAAGIIDHETGTRDIRKLHGLLKTMPVTSTLAIIAALAMAGIPFLNGFLSKEMFFAETLQIEGHAVMGWVLALVAVLAGIFSMAYSLRFVHDCFFTGSTEILNKTPHEPPRMMRVPVELLVLLCLAVGIAPAWVIGPVLETAVRGATHGNVPDYYLAVWHGFNLPLLMSFIAVAGGIALYFGLRRFVKLHRDVRRSFGFAAFHAQRLHELHANQIAAVARDALDFGRRLKARTLRAGVDTAVKHGLAATCRRRQQQRPQPRRIRLGEVDMNDGRFGAAEEGALSTVRVVDDLVGHDQRAGTVLGAYAAHGRHRDHALYPEFLQRPDVGAVVDLVRSDRMTIAMPRQKHYLTTGEGADGDRARRLAERRAHHLPAHVG